MILVEYYNITVIQYTHNTHTKKICIYIQLHCLLNVFAALLLIVSFVFTTIRSQKILIIMEVYLTFKVLFFVCLFAIRNSYVYYLLTHILFFFLFIFIFNASCPSIADVNVMNGLNAFLNFVCAHNVCARVNEGLSCKCVCVRMVLMYTYDG